MKEGQRLIQMHHTNPISWVYMPQLIFRARKFADNHNLDFNADMAEEAIRVHFVALDPMVMSWVLVDGVEVVGHLVVSIDSLVNYSGAVIQRYATILQAESKYPVPDMIPVVKEWAKWKGCNSVIALALGAARVRLFKKYGFDEYRTLLKISLED